MAKSSGYMRDYRAMRAANQGMPLTDPWSPRGMEALMPAHSRGDTIANEIMPTGRAPRGEGAEYAARRALAKRFETNAQDITRQRQKLGATRGQARFVRRDTVARERLQMLEKARQDAIAVARAPGSWVFKRDLINAILDTPRMVDPNWTG